MRKFVILLGMFLATGMLMAQDGATGGGSWWTAGAAMALASGLCGLAQGQGTRAACDGIARNPGAANDIRTTMIIGLALIESLALYTLVVVFVKG